MPDSVLIKSAYRSQGLLIIGMIFKTTIPDESDEERRELERMVAEAAAGKSKRHKDNRASHTKSSFKPEGSTFSATEPSIEKPGPQIEQPAAEKEKA